VIRTNKILASFTITIENIVYTHFPREYHGSSGLGGTKVVLAVGYISHHVTGVKYMKLQYKK
jgi:hypothetical protein